MPKNESAETEQQAETDQTNDGGNAQTDPNNKVQSDDEKQQSVTTHTQIPSPIPTPREDNKQQESSSVENNDSYQSSSIFEPDWGGMETTNQTRT